ncbi:MAG: 2-C-methyl-D-erythritol 2,4-cyclodiphosphate synthase [Deltaproteobacteria bacterium HGW-Deltaproteobacteria-21]|nr:MAG: 2-C-methyl-D-erythritol 2,4-cyclodiphosphate synthase [Deltaproteobacteria bacterium HGW-Deltaproteobacteria-21]
MFRIGFGYDVHRLVEGRSLILGGLRIPHSMGLLGHSDADVLVHALMDALLGSLARGDIGQHFPDSDESYKDASSLVLLERVMDWVRDEGFAINNIDSTIVAEKPKLAAHIPAMRETLARVLKISEDRVSIKATTCERMGFCGREEGIAAYAVVILMAEKMGRQE